MHNIFDQIPLKSDHLSQVLLVFQPETDGYIAMILTKLQDHDKEIDKLLTYEAYSNKLEKRRLKSLSKLADNMHKKDTSMTKVGTKPELCHTLENKTLPENGMVDVEVAEGDKCEFAVDHVANVKDTNSCTGVS